ncbi:LamG domain-containing protein [Candidatus Poribacteria bacterium]
MLKRVTLALLTLAVLTLLISNGVNSQICPEGMISYWKADGDASDSYGDNDGTEYGNVIYETGQVGQAFEFDGYCTDETRTAVRILSPSNIPIGNSPWSLSMWVMIYEYPTHPNLGLIFDRGDVSGVERGMHRLAVGWWWNEQTTTRLWNSFWGPSWAYDTGVIINLGTWYHIANTYDGATAKIYIDGVERWTKNIGSPLDVRDSEIWLGGSGCHLSAGKIDEVAIYNRPLTPEEILQHYENGLNGLGYCEQAPLAVTIDIKPGSDPNCFNNDGHGAIPVAILGSAALDVTQIDASTVELQGMAVKAVGKSNKLLAHIEDVNDDGFDDLVVQIEDSDGTFTSGDATAIVTGNLLDGTPFEGADTICIVGNSSLAPRLRTRSKLTTTWAGIKSRH